MSKGKVRYLVPEHGQTIEDSRDVKIYDHSNKRFKPLLCEPESIEDHIQDICKFIWDHNDGWEWIHGGVVISIAVDGKVVGNFDIDVEVEPVFIVEKIEGGKNVR